MTETIDTRKDRMRAWLTGKQVLITGGTGSLGQALIPRLAGVDVAVYSRNETFQNQSRQKFPLVEYFTGCVSDEKAFERTLDAVKPDVIFHLAAQKIIPTTQRNVNELIKINVGGSQVVSDAARKRNIHVVGVSTDKASAPVNYYGVSKRMMEGILLNNGHACVRYGNVINSANSVFPYWRTVAAKGLSIPITHREMTRFWMTIECAVDIVLAAVGLSGKVLIPSLRSARMLDLAEQFGPSVSIIGMRLGEKVHEHLWDDTEVVSMTHYLEHGVYDPLSSPQHDPGSLPALTSENAERWDIQELMSLI
jgi:UDP-N-acetylglucosamine 4,6-dehydratase